MTEVLSDRKIQCDLSPPKRYITTHTTGGKSIFYTGIPPEVPCQPIQHDVDFYLTYTTSEFPTELGAENDIAKYRAFLQGSKPGLVNKGGSVVRICDFAPHGDAVAAPMHRTISIDYGIVTAGEIECWLDSGERQSLKVGDIVVQRETNHAWKNPSTDKWARMVFILQEARPLQSGSVELKEEYGYIPGVAPST
jgi:quercetin dioxygenase-like cupin family protein